jgi:hypothetical protein
LAVRLSAPLYQVGSAPNEARPEANDRVRSSWRLRKIIPSSFREERGPRYDTCANGVLGSVKMRFWAICLRVVSEARRGKATARARRHRALSIQRLEGSRPRFAADAGPNQIQGWEGAASSGAEAVPQSATRSVLESSETSYLLRSWSRGRELNSRPVDGSRNL